jgi:cyclophilin family peptidyl-prolyl cis-trans isomerase
MAAILPEDAGALPGDDFGVLLAAVGALGDDPPKDAAPLLAKIARLAVPPGASPPTVRRAASLRCAAAASLAKGAWDSGLITACDPGDGEASERARLAAVDRGPWLHARRAAWLEVVRSAHLRVREAALQDASHHPELGDALLPVLADALSSDPPGLVAAAAEVLHSHPERAFVLAAAERHAALDPRAPPPSSSPAREIDPRIARALRAALARAWAPDLVETRTGLLDAAVALALPDWREYARGACKDANATVRSRAARALGAAGDKDSACSAPEPGGEPAPELAREVSRPTRVTFVTDAGASLAIVFDPSFAPVAATRFVALAKSGFYTGVAVHRVVPAFVVQFGDHGGDGYGGSGQTLRCETSPVPFGALDVGVALAGRDTGSSQLFVTLARHPHLDGEYAWVGRAEGDWNAVADGDRMSTVRVEE